MKNLILFTTLCLYSFLSLGQSLSEYRKQALELLKSTPKAELSSRTGLDSQRLNEVWLSARAKNRVQALREQLGTSSYEIPGWNNDWSLANNRSKKPSASDFLKRFTREGIQALREVQLYSKPITFDPSELDEERKLAEDKRVFDAFNQVIEERIGAGQEKIKLRDLALSFYDQYVKEASFDESKTCSDITDVMDSFYPQALVENHSGAAQILQDYIKNQAPVGEKTLEDVLGHIRRLDVVNGRIRRLKVTTCTQVPFGAKVVLMGTEETTLTLGILINIVSGLDGFFLKTQDYFIDMVDDLRTPLMKDVQKFYGLGKYFMDLTNQAGAADLEIYGKIIEYMTKRQEGARFIHDQLMSLTVQQQRFLLDLLLQLQGSDIPAREDIALLNEARIEMTSGENLRYTDPNDINTLKDSIADIDYFKSLDTDLGFLEDSLREEQQNKQAVELAIERIGVKK